MQPQTGLRHYGFAPGSAVSPDNGQCRLVEQTAPCRQ